jgi:2-polyprenyl-3-methyl-5-hydroxy-6-metoxy-1,4-benzoquinol methylase
MLTHLRAIPVVGSGPGAKLLDAGCGISLIPRVLAFWGFQVTAVDFSVPAIRVAERQAPSEADLARCIPIWDPVSPGSRTLELVEDPERSLQMLRQYRAEGGSVRYLACGWQECPRSEPFDLIYCRNSLRCSLKVYWRCSLRCFWELLVPGGVLLLETLNAIGIQDEVEELLAECGFTTVPETGDHPPPDRYVFAIWPTG